MQWSAAHDYVYFIVQWHCYTDCGGSALGGAVQSMIVHRDVMRRDLTAVNPCSIPNEHGVPLSSARRLRAAVPVTDSNVTTSLFAYVRGLVEGGHYNISVTATNDAGNSTARWVTCVGRGDVSAPAVPYNLTAVATASGITVSWLLDDASDVANCTAACGRACGGIATGVQCVWAAIDDNDSYAVSSVTSRSARALSCFRKPPCASGSCTYVFGVSCANDNGTTKSVTYTNFVNFPPNDCSSPPEAPARPVLVAVDRY